MTNIEQLSLSEIESLLKAAERRKALLANRRPPHVVRKELAALADSHGYAIEELFAFQSVPRAPTKRTRKKSNGKVPEKYRDPANKRNTWSGRGSLPRWLSEKVRRGEQVADYLIPGLARPTEKNVKSIGRRTVYKPDVGSSDTLSGNAQ